MDFGAEIRELKGDIKTLQTDVAEIKGTQPLLKNMFERNITVQEKLTETLHEVEKSMVSINDKVDAQSKDIASIKNEMDETTDRINHKINKVEDRIRTVDEEGKFNIRKFFQNYFPWIVVLVGIGAHFASELFNF